MVKINKLHLGLGIVIAVIAFIALYFFWQYVPRTIPGTSVLDEINVEERAEGPDIKLIGAYWGTSEDQASEDETCSNDTMNLKEGFTFTVEAETRILAINYDECYVVNNGEKAETVINEMHGNIMDFQAKAETDRESDVGICCELGDELHCSETTRLLQCALE